MTALAQREKNSARFAVLSAAAIPVICFLGGGIGMSEALARLASALWVSDGRWNFRDYWGCDK
jgi:hypothetical protein